MLQKRLVWALFCFVVLNPRVLSTKTELILGFCFCFINFPIFFIEAPFINPPPPSSAHSEAEDDIPPSVAAALDSWMRGNKV